MVAAPILKTSKSFAMKLLLISILLMAGCATSRENGGCGTENYKHKFRARLTRIEDIGIGFKLHWRRMNNHFVTYCTGVADSLKVGSYYCI